MFQIDSRYLEEEIGLSNAIRRTGVYNAVIKKADIWKSEHSQSEALNLEIETEDEKSARLSLFYKKKTGEEIEFNMRHINHLMYLLGIDNLKEGQDKLVPALMGKKIGAIIKVGKRDGDEREFYQYTLQGFFDPDTKMTAKEKSQNLKAEVIDKAIASYKNEKDVILNESKKEDVSGFYPVSDEEIPF